MLSQGPLPSVVTEWALDHQPRPAALSPIKVLGPGWGEAHACGNECETTVAIGCDMLVGFILSEQVDLLCDRLKKQAGVGALRAGS